MKKIEIAVFGVICILIGIALAGYIVSSGENDSDRDGWTDIQEREVHTNPFDVDSDHDGIQDPEDPEPLHPGILTNPEQKLEEGGYLEYGYEWGGCRVAGGDFNVTHDDIRLPNGSTKVDCKRIGGGYGEGRWCSYYSYRSPTRVLDFFIDKMMQDGWDNSYYKFDSIGWAKEFGILKFQKLEGGSEGVYVTIIVIGLESGPEYSQFTIHYEVPD